MSHTQKCPVCEGTGSYIGRVCHGCDGKGLISVNSGDLNCLICKTPSFMCGISVYFGDFDKFVCHFCHEKHPLLWKVIVDVYCFFSSGFYYFYDLFEDIKATFLEGRRNNM